MSSSPFLEQRRSRVPSSISLCWASPSTLWRLLYIPPWESYGLNGLLDLALACIPPHWGQRKWFMSRPSSSPTDKLNNLQLDVWFVIANINLIGLSETLILYEYRVSVYPTALERASSPWVAVYLFFHLKRWKVSRGQGQDRTAGLQRRIMPALYWRDRTLPIFSRTLKLIGSSSLGWFFSNDERK